jgi:hypothetical protein
MHQQVSVVGQKLLGATRRVEIKKSNWVIKAKSTPLEASESEEACNTDGSKYDL